MGESRRLDLHHDPFWHSCSDCAEASLSATPSSITWTQVSGLQPLVELCLRQTLKLLPRPEMWHALGPVPTACLLFLDAYYQAWSQQVSVACLPSSVPWVPASILTHHPLLPSPKCLTPSNLCFCHHITFSCTDSSCVLLRTHIRPYIRPT